MNIDLLELCITYLIMRESSIKELKKCIGKDFGKYRNSQRRRRFKSEESKDITFNYFSQNGLKHIIIYYNWNEKLIKKHYVDRILNKRLNLDCCDIISEFL